MICECLSSINCIPRTIFLTSIRNGVYDGGKLNNEDGTMDSKEIGQANLWARFLIANGIEDHAHFQQLMVSLQSRGICAPLLKPYKGRNVMELITQQAKSREVKMQMKLDFNKPIRVVEDEKKTELISFRIGEKFKKDLEETARAKGCSLSELCMEYLADGFTKDYKQVIYLQTHGHKTLREMLQG